MKPGRNTTTLKACGQLMFGDDWHGGLCRGLHIMPAELEAILNGALISEWVGTNSKSAWPACRGGSYGGAGRHAGALMRPFLLAIALFASVPAHAEVRVIDGDTMDLNGQRVRLWGIDAPEGKQSCQRDGVAWLCGEESAKALRELVAGNDIACREVNRDRYKRSVAVCSVGDTEINAWMAREGWAIDYRQYSRGEYAGAEKEAREARRGLWAGPFLAPWEWRRTGR